MEEKTVRQRIIEALRGGFLSAKDISKAAGIREKDVREHHPCGEVNPQGTEARKACL